VEEYEHFEQVENGDLSWYVDNKFLAFAGPHAEREMGPGGYYTHRPEDYIPHFKRRNVSLVVSSLSHSLKHQLTNCVVFIVFRCV
jgi:cell division cycle 14